MRLHGPPMSLPRRRAPTRYSSASTGSPRRSCTHSANMNSTLSTSAKTSEAQRAPPNHAHAPVRTAATPRAAAMARTIEMNASDVKEHNVVRPFLQRSPEPSTRDAFKPSKRDDRAQAEHDQVTEPWISPTDLDRAKAGGDRHRVPKRGGVAAQRLSDPADESLTHAARLPSGIGRSVAVVAHSATIRRTPSNSPEARVW